MEPGQRRLRQIHVIYRYGARAGQVQDIITFLQTNQSLDRAQIQQVVRALDTVRKGLRNDFQLLGRDTRQFETDLWAITEYLLFEPDLSVKQTQQIVKRLKQLRKWIKDDFEALHGAFYE